MKSLIERKTHELKNLQTAIQGEIDATQNRLNNLQISLIGISYQLSMLADLGAEQDVTLIHSPEESAHDCRQEKEVVGDDTDAGIDGDCRVIKFVPPKTAAGRAGDGYREDTH